MIKYVLLAVLATPIQAAELPQCAEKVNAKGSALEAEGYHIIDIRQFPDALMLVFKTTDELHTATILVTTSKDGYSLKGGATVVEDGECLLGDAKAYYAVAKMADPQARAQQ